MASGEPSAACNPPRGTCDRALTRRATPELEQTLAEATIRLIGPMLFAGFIEEVVELARSVACLSISKRTTSTVWPKCWMLMRRPMAPVPALTALSGLQKELTDGSLAGRFRQLVEKKTGTSSLLPINFCCSHGNYYAARTCLRVF